MPALKLITVGAFLAFAAQSAFAAPAPLSTDQPSGSDGDDWVPAKIIDKRLATAPETIPSGDSDDWVPAYIIEKRSFEDASSIFSRDKPTSAHSSLAGCFKRLQPNWPNTQLTKTQGEECIKENYAKRDQNSDIGKRDEPDQAQSVQNGDDTLSAICSTANIVLSNFVTDGDLSTNLKKGTPSDLAGTICKNTLSAVASMGQPFTTVFEVQAGHKKGLSIVHAGRKLSLYATAASYAFDLTKPLIYQRAMDMCKQTVVNQAQTCTTNLYYGAADHQVDHVVKPFTGFWRKDVPSETGHQNAGPKSVLDMMFDFGFEMPPKKNHKHD